MDLMRQTLANRYRIERPLGEGAFAETYLASDIVLGRNVAVKVLRGELAERQDDVARFEREARTAASVSHPNIVPIYDVGSSDGLTYLVMEWVPGTTLKQQIQRRPRMDLETALRIADDLLAGVEAIHTEGIIHRDIKPQNVLVTPAGTAKLTDFGVAYSAHSPATNEPEMAMGTAAYMAPEQARGMEATTQADVYAVGVILYEMLTGRLPFPGDDPVQVIQQHLEHPVRRPKRINPNIPAPLEQLILRAMRKNPRERFATGATMRRALERASRAIRTDGFAIADHAYVPGTVRRTSHRPRLAWLLATAMLMFTMLAGTTVIAMRDLTPPPVDERPEPPYWASGVGGVEMGSMESLDSLDALAMIGRRGLDESLPPSPEPEPEPAEETTPESYPAPTSESQDGGPAEVTPETKQDAPEPSESPATEQEPEQPPQTEAPPTPEAQRNDESGVEQASSVDADGENGADDDGVKERVDGEDSLDEQDDAGGNDVDSAADSEAPEDPDAQDEDAPDDWIDQDVEGDDGSTENESVNEHDFATEEQTGPDEPSGVGGTSGESNHDPESTEDAGESIDESESGEDGSDGSSDHYSTGDDGQDPGESPESSGNNDPAAGADVDNTDQDGDAGKHQGGEGSTQEQSVGDGNASADPTDQQGGPDQMQQGDDGDESDEPGGDQQNEDNDDAREPDEESSPGNANDSLETESDDSTDSTAGDHDEIDDD